MKAVVFHLPTSTTDLTVKYLVIYFLIYGVFTFDKRALRLPTIFSGMIYIRWLSFLFIQQLAVGGTVAAQKFRIPGWIIVEEIGDNNTIQMVQFNIPTVDQIIRVNY